MAAPSSESERDSYQRLRAIARALLAGERRNHTLTPTALVHEAWLRQWRADAEPDVTTTRLTMQRVLIDHARRRRRLKRGSGHHSELDDNTVAAIQGEVSADELRDALAALTAVSAKHAAAWQAHYLSGQSSAQIASTHNVTQRCVQGWLRAANSYLRVALLGPDT